MQLSRRRTMVLLLAMVLLVSTVVLATTVRHMNLEEMCTRADRIFRGTVVDITEGSVYLGGAELATVTYTVQVDEAFKGNYTEVKGVRVTEVTMISTGKGVAAGKFSTLPQLPRLRVGKDYVLLVTTPSAYGLSTTVGIGQGCFGVHGLDKAEMVANELNNHGLYDGPVAYSRLAADIRAILGQ